MQNKKCVPRKNAQLTERVKPTGNEPKKALPPPKPKPNKPEPVKKEETPSAPAAKNTSSTSTSSKKSGSISGMFAKAAAKPYKRPEKPKEAAKKEEEETSPGKENRLNEEEEERSRKRQTSKSKLESQPKRKRSLLASGFLGVCLLNAVIVGYNSVTDNLFQVRMERMGKTFLPLGCARENVMFKAHKGGILSRH